MRLIVGCIGKLKSGPEAELAKRYGERLAQTARGLGLTGPEIIELPEGRSSNSDQRKTDEADRLRENISERAVTIAFDERGKSVSSQEFSKMVQKHLDQGTRDLVLLIGGADGLDATLRDDADYVFSFGKLTMPHQIVRILVMEQLYRATTILANHPYHRD